MNKREIAGFQKSVIDFYHKQGRHDLPWRKPETDGSFDPYKILVSEIMLQQTQVARVIPKYEEFMANFPDVNLLAKASLGEVLVVWNGLGYNRRAKFLLQASRIISGDFAGKFPTEVNELEKLPGVGPNTAGAIAVYAFNKPEVFIETNIRTVFIHHFIHDKKVISDKEILTLVKETLSGEEGKRAAGQNLFDFARAKRKTAGLSLYRLWFWALMDYGSYLKRTVGNLNSASKSYAKQSKFAGSKRQLRGEVIRKLLERKRDAAELEALLADDRLNAVLEDLKAEGLISKTGKYFSIS